jgi:peptidyl-prolyl cis-trans isomerase SurA
MAPYAAQIKQSGYNLDDERKALYRVRSEVLQNIIDAKLTSQQMARYKIEVTDSELDKVIANFLKQHNATEEKFQADLQKTGMTVEEYRESVREQLLRNRIVNIAIKSKIVITQQDVERYYEENLDKYTGEKAYHLRNIVMPVSSFASEKEKQAVRAEIDAVYQTLQQGASFAEMARQHSKSPLARTGGDLGYFEIGVMAPEIQQAIQRLGKQEFTPVLDTDRGFQIFYVEDMRSSTGKSLEEAYAEIEELLNNEAINTQYRAWLENLRKNAHIRIID